MHSTRNACAVIACGVPTVDTIEKSLSIRPSFAKLSESPAALVLSRCRQLPCLYASRVGCVLINSGPCHVRLAFGSGLNDGDATSRTQANELKNQGEQSEDDTNDTGAQPSFLSPGHRGGCRADGAT
jgi:hypothetical protein